jgi:hypothetical protein
MKKSVLIIALSIFLFAGCASKSFDINKVDFSYEYASLNILPLKYHDRSSLNSETANKVMKGILAKDSSAWGYYYVQHSFSQTESKILDIGTIEFIVDIMNILGFPKSRMFYNLKACAYLFDANGDIVEIYEKSGNIMKYKGWYYGRSVPVEDMSKEYQRMFKEIIDDIIANKEQTNGLLVLAGTLEEDDKTEVYTKIYMIIK